MTNADWRSLVEDQQKRAKLHRKRGDALRRTGQLDQAMKEFRAGLSVLNQAISTLESTPAWALTTPGAPGPLGDEARDVLAELIEAYGSCGGMHRRLGELPAALQAYRHGAKLESDHGATSTYNRVNAVKLALLSSAAGLAALSPDIAALEALLTRQLTDDQALSDGAWSWADLGDCRALLGDVPGAERAYRTFVEKAGSHAPSSTLEVLRDIVKCLQTAGDTGARLVADSLSVLEARLT
jgi:tetratricopeptide (TPR) repeat protein